MELVVTVVLEVTYLHILRDKKDLSRRVRTYRLRHLQRAIHVSDIHYKYNSVSFCVVLFPDAPQVSLRGHQLRFNRGRYLSAEVPEGQHSLRMIIHTNCNSVSTRHTARRVLLSPTVG